MMSMKHKSEFGETENSILARTRSRSEDMGFNQIEV